MASLNIEMRLLYLSLIVSLVHVFHDFHIVESHDFGHDEYLEDYGYENPEDYIEVDNRVAAWRRRVLATKASSEWRTFKRAFKKHYSSDTEEEDRVANYLATKDLVERHNRSPGENFTMVINHFADYSDEEFDRMNGYKESSDSKNITEEDLSFVNQFDRPVPDSWDWRKHDGVLTPVKDQGLCGACWAFVTTALLEGQQKKVGMQSTSLSPQQLVDCEVKSKGCSEGQVRTALDHIVAAGGIEGWTTYPYLGAQHVCRQRPDKFIMKGGSWIALGGGTEKDMERIVANYGPVVVAIRATVDFRFWGSGVFDKCKHNETVDHAVLLVGYGEENRNPYWLIKNSWAETWGQGGYGKIKRGVNMCGLMTLPIIVRLGPK